MSLDIPFTLREDLTVQLDGETGALEGDTLVVTDAPLEVKFAKVDENGDPLPGAVLTLTDQATGEEIDRWTTTTEPHVITGWTEGGTALIAGHTYVLHEESAPEGYELAEDVEFEVEATGDVQTVTMEDEATPAPAVEGGEPFDKTGVNLAPLAAVSAAIAAAGFGCLAVAMKRCREKDAEELGEREIPEIR